MPAPNFSPYPFARLRKTTRAEAAFESVLAQHLAARTRPFAKLERLVAAPVRAQIVGVADAIDPHAAHAEVRVANHSIIVVAPSLPVRTLAQRWLGGPDELAAPRPLTVAEHAIWCLVVASALADLAIDAQVWPLLDDDRAKALLDEARAPRSPALASTIAARPVVELANPGAATVVAVPHARQTHDARRDGHARAGGGGRPGGAQPGVARTGDAQPGGPRHAARPDGTRPDPFAIEIAVVLGDLAMTVVAFVPRAIELRVPSPRPVPAWSFDIPIVVARAAIHRDAIARLAVRDIVTVDRTLELEIGDGTVSLSAAPGALEAKVATGYVPRDMALPDDAHLELSVQLGTTRLSLRQLSELAVGQVISLARPLAGPFEVRAGGRLVGHGELIDIDGELGVRIVSLAQE